MKTINENTKVTVTLDQLKRLVLEAEEQEEEEQEEEEKPEETGDTSYDKLLAFGGKLLVMATEVHFWHLNTDNNAAHLALKDLYDGLTDLGDKLLESVIGKANKSIESKPEYDIGTMKFDDSCIAKIKETADEAESLVGMSEGIDNVLGDICELCDEAVYKLTRLS